MKKIIFSLIVILSFIFASALVQSCSGLQQGIEGGFSNSMSGTWKSESLDMYYCLLKDGNGYYESHNKYNGIVRRVLRWNVEDNKLFMELPEDDYFAFSKHTFDIINDSDAVKIVEENGSKKIVYTKVSEVVPDADYQSKPYMNYIRIYGYYYKLSEAVMRCKHGTGTNANFKHLIFNGANGELTPFGAIFSYSTPSYEGIDKEWSDGSYSIVTKSSFWVYHGWYYNRSSSSEVCPGKLSIKTIGGVKIFDFNLDGADCVGHLEGNWYYE